MTLADLEPRLSQIISLIGPVGVVLIVMSVFSVTLIFLKLVAFARHRLGDTRNHKTDLTRLAGR